jgi:hypothetical protein
VAAVCLWQHLSVPGGGYLSTPGGSDCNPFTIYQETVQPQMLA